MLSKRFFLNTEQSAVSAENGFLPSAPPLTELPASSELNVDLNQIAKSLPELMQKKTLRATIDSLNAKFSDTTIVLESDNPQQKRVATLLLTMLAQAYVWEDIHKPSQTVPAVIARPLYQLCKQEQRFPTLTYADYILYNWRLKNPSQGIVPENIEPIFTFTGTKDEAWFIKIHVAIEAAASTALVSAFNAYQLANSMVAGSTYLCDANKEKELILLFGKIQQSLQAATAMLKRMYEECRPDYFWNILRLYLNGWEKVKSQQTAEVGVRFEGVATKDKLPSHSYKGSSGAQSSIIPALDAALGVRHEINGMFKTLLEFKSYMPMEHQTFISVLSRGKIDMAVRRSGSKEMFSAWESAVKQIGLFRGGHMGLVMQYLHSPAAKTGIKPEEIVGTGGTPITEYLGGRHQTTQDTVVDMPRIKSKL
jgi:indoleamine 2,3-dioxygenase